MVECLIVDQVTGVRFPLGAGALDKERNCENGLGRRQHECDGFLDGNPRGRYGSRVNASWEKKNIVHITPPYTCGWETF